MIFSDRSFAPTGFRPKKFVTGSVLLVGNHFLVIRRRSKATHASTWSAPGGTIEPNETARRAAVRELFEEAGILLEPGVFERRVYRYVRFEHINLDITYTGFLARLRERPVVHLNDEHVECRWVTLQEALQLPLIPHHGECLKACVLGTG